MSGRFPPDDLGRPLAPPRRGRTNSDLRYIPVRRDGAGFRARSSIVTNENVNYEDPEIHVDDSPDRVNFLLDIDRTDESKQVVYRPTRPLPTQYSQEVSRAIFGASDLMNGASSPLDRFLPDTSRQSVLGLSRPRPHSGPVGSGRGRVRVHGHSPDFVVPSSSQFDTRGSIAFASQTHAAHRRSSRHRLRNCNPCPLRVLDAPELVDDFYLNVLDWSSRNTVGIGLSSIVYFWQAQSGMISDVKECDDGDYVSCVRFTQDGSYVAISTNGSRIVILDVEKRRRLRLMGGHSSRVGCLAWSGPLLATGSRDSLVLVHDVRTRRHIVRKFLGHQQEICGLCWSTADDKKIASGGNDNFIYLWDAASRTVNAPLCTFDKHVAAVKALDWCPWNPRILASGGGTADRRMLFWDVLSGKIVNSVDTKSQVCGLRFATNGDHDLLSVHGFSMNQVTLWEFPSLLRIVDLVGHTQRVLHMALSPDGTTLCTAGADETMRFWQVFGKSSSLAAGGADSLRPGGGARRSNQSFASSTMLMTGGRGDGRGATVIAPYAPAGELVDRRRLLGPRPVRRRGRPVEMNPFARFAGRGTPQRELPTSVEFTFPPGTRSLSRSRSRSRSRSSGSLDASSFSGDRPQSVDSLLFSDTDLMEGSSFLETPGRPPPTGFPPGLGHAHPPGPVTVPGGNGRHPYDEESDDDRGRGTEIRSRRKRRRSGAGLASGLLSDDDISLESLGSTPGFLRAGTLSGSLLSDIAEDTPPPPPPRSVPRHFVPSLRSRGTDGILGSLGIPRLSSPRRRLRRRKHGREDLDKFR